MKIRTKITILTGALILGTTFIVLGQYFLEKERLSDFLKEVTREEKDSFNLLVSLSSSNISTLARDYTFWDEMVEYVNNPDPIFAEENINEGVNVFNASSAYVYNIDKELVYAYDINHQVPFINFSKETLEELMRSRFTHFFARTNSNITEFSAATIHPTNDSERITKPQGLFIVGKHWDNNYISNLENLSGMSIIHEGEEIPNEEDSSIKFSYQILDKNNNIIETFTIVSPLPIFDDMQRASRNQLLFIIFSTLLMLFVIFISLNRLVGKPIESLSRSIKKKDIELMKKMQKSPSEFGVLAKLVLDFSEHELVLQSKAKDEAILSAVGSGLIAVDKEKRISLFNVAAEHLFGVNAKDALGKSVDSVFETRTHSGFSFSPEDFPLSKALREKKLVSETVQCITKDGKKFPAVITAAPVILNNEVIGAVQDLRDITSEEALEQSKRDFISLISHELRTPLTSLDWTVEKLESEKNLPLDIIESTIPYMRSSLNRIKTLVSAMIEVSKIESGSVITASNELEISVLIDNSIKELKPGIEAKKLKIEINDETDDKDTVLSDEKLLQIIINNLISNAVRYSNENGIVRINIKKDEKEFVIDIANTGEGIPEEEQSRIFSKMFRATNAKLISPDGVGLGLFISKSFLEKLGGSLTFLSIPNKETIFSIHLPVLRK
ncbi:MAG: ATP-binding protein [Candidatus Paceibacterota bacterium]